MTARPGTESSHEVAPGLSAFRQTRAELLAAQQGQRRDHGEDPSLMLTIWRGPLRVKLRMVLTEYGTDHKRRQVVLREADWDPREVTPRLLVEWSHRATASWLAEQDHLLHVGGSPAVDTAQDAHRI